MSENLPNNAVNSKVVKNCCC